MRTCRQNSRVLACHWRGEGRGGLDHCPSPGLPSHLLPAPHSMVVQAPGESHTAPLEPGAACPSLCTRSPLLPLPTACLKSPSPPTTLLQTWLRWWEPLQLYWGAGRREPHGTVILHLGLSWLSHQSHSGDRGMRGRRPEAPSTAVPKAHL